jgi:hypothetical protein
MWLKAWGKLPNNSPLAASTVGEQADVVDERRGSFEHDTRPLGPAGHGQGLGEPEGV